MNRRHFNSLMAGLSLSAMTPAGLAAGSTARWDRILVLVELNGGNDGLNTIVPYTDPTYYRLRPSLAIARDSILQLSPTLGLNPMMEPLMTVWDDDELAIVQGVGYPGPNRSHFRSIEIWETASEANEYLDMGWLARLLSDASRPDSFAADSVVLGRGNLGALRGGGLTNIVMRAPEKLIRRARALGGTSTTSDNTALAHLLGVQQNLYQAAEALASSQGREPSWDKPFPRSPISRQLRGAAGIIAGDAVVPVLKLSHGSFDTHSNQRNNHDRLLAELAEGLSVFRAAMKQVGLWDRVLVMTYSEFGRRVAENGSRGTDHGTAAPHLLLGGKVKGGLYANAPSLSALTDSDLRHSVDFRSLYATVARSWWQLPADSVSRGHPSIDCIA